jgi:class 3 adenylate cyclase
MTAGPSDIRYAPHGEAHLAFRTWGDGPPLAYVPSQFIAITAMEDEPAYERFLSRLGEFATVITFDRLGIGQSDPMPDVPSVDDWTAQIESVITGAGFESAFILAHAFGGIPAIALAATQPERVRGLILAMALKGTTLPPDIPLDRVVAAARPNASEQIVDYVQVLAPSRVDDSAFRRWWDDAGQRGASPAVAQSLLALQANIDASEHIASVTVPTLVITRPAYGTFPWPGAMEVDIPGARVVEVGGIDLLPWLPDSDAVVAEVEQFVTGEHRRGEVRRVVLAVMFTDVVGSTSSAVKLGDRQWTDLLELHDRLLRRELARHDGTEIDTAGDGFLSTFATPSEAIRCAARLHRAMEEIGLQLRIGIHCGEVELREPGIAGITVHIAARVQAKASPGETLVTSTTREVVTGSGVNLTLKGRFSLKGVPDRWALFTVDS